MWCFTIFSNDTEQGVATTAAHNKSLIKQLKKGENLFTDISTIEKNKDGCA